MSPHGSDMANEALKSCHGSKRIWEHIKEHRAGTSISLQTNLIDSLLRFRTECNEDADQSGSISPRGRIDHCSRTIKQVTLELYEYVRATHEIREGTP